MFLTIMAKSHDRKPKRINSMIRACIPDSDYDRVTELLNLAETNPVTADTIRRWDSRAGFILRRSISVDDQNRVTGCCVVVHAPWAAAGRFYVWVIVDSLFSPADAGDTVEMRRKLWHVNYQTHLDDPASAGTFPSFDEMTGYFS
jgi:hypothetical protein